MFNSIKKIFTRKETSSVLADDVILFKDLKLQSLEISIKADGNSNVIVINEIKTETEIVLDAEKSLLLGFILTTYAKDGKLTNILETLKENEIV